ncbi:MAG: bifunctional UDP-N-acetylglucosamine diphosphorylase/glucosamine-1-phosphate N-acetyltransferase GlmU [Alphaproteobacteria bacterium]|nr:bifunctional UDP-N-acetylglucosamine diphosphorylase/glucosamine-1-phosphate N-acetyltransferase GlmU [Alphaproteobacteria bacterium]
MIMDLQVVVLAAGQGTRMKSDTPKILHPLGGRPVFHYALDLAQRMTPQEVIVVVSPSLKELDIPFSHQTVVQQPALGTGDAVKWALPHLNKKGHVLILFGDTPLILKETLDRMTDLAHARPDMAVILLGMRPLDKQNYARLVLNDKGELETVIEYKDATPAQKEISLCNSGVMLVRGDLLDDLLSALKPDNAAKEYYLTDLVKIARKEGHACGIVEGESSEFMGINTRQDLAKAENILQNRWRYEAMTAGVTLMDPNQVYLSYDTTIESDVTIHPFVVLGTGVEIEKGAEILSFCQLSDTHVGPQAVVGPFARLRGGVQLSERAEVGNFVEVKNSTFGSKAKAKHLSYIGDTQVGSKANIGAGTITCNYDGFSKFKTHIGEGVFIGSNSSLIAPLSIGDNAIIGAGSVITKDIESGALGVARGKQINLEKGAIKFREVRKKRKEK